MNYQLSIWEEQSRPLVRMHNDLILAQFAKLNVTEMRIFLIMLAKVEWGADKLKKIRVALRDIDPSIIISESNEHFKRVTKAADALTEKLGNVKIHFMRDGKRVWLKSVIIQSAEYVEGTDFVECSWGEAMAPYLLNLKGNFTTEELSELLKQTSTNAIRFYLLVKSLYRENQVCKLSVHDLKMMLFNDENAYPEYKVLKREVINKAIDDLKNTSCAFRIEEEKKKKFVVAITIIPLRTKIVLNVFSEDIEQLMSRYKVNPNRIRHMFSNGEITEDYIRFVFDTCLRKVKPDHKDIGGYIHEAIVKQRFRKEYDKRKVAPRAVAPSTAVSKVKKEFIPLVDLRQMQERSRRKNPHETADLKQWVEEIFIQGGGYQVEYKDKEWVGISRIVSY